MWFIKIYRSIFYELFTLAKRLLSDGTPEWSAAGVLASLCAMNFISIVIFIEDHFKIRLSYLDRSSMLIIFGVIALIHYGFFLKGGKYINIIEDAEEHKLLMILPSRIITYGYILCSVLFLFLKSYL
jgi:hypothetical protein